MDRLTLQRAKSQTKPLTASQSLTETFPCTDLKVFSLQGKAPEREPCYAHWELSEFTALPKLLAGPSFPRAV